MSKYSYCVVVDGKPNKLTRSQSPLRSLARAHFYNVPRGGTLTQYHFDDPRIRLRVLSLGAGVQSSTLALMIEHGEVEPVDCAIFADTMAEPKKVYEYLSWLRTQVSFPIFTTSLGNLEKDSLRVQRSKKSGNLYVRAELPLYTLSDTGERGMMPRQCTRNYKIVPINRKVRDLLDVKMINNRHRNLVTMLIGISTDEVQRMKPSRLDWITNSWPLIDLNMSRRDCLERSERFNLPRPPRSSCKMCPYHSDDEWLHLIETSPEEFNEAVEYERRANESFAQSDINSASVFLHKSRVPLDKVQFVRGVNARSFNEECEGMCGL